MPNPHRGEISAELGGRSYALCLTLGALAELEAAFGAEDLLALAARFESGRISSRDAIRILGAGLRGGGNVISDDEVATLPAPGGLPGHLDIVARLLVATFGEPETASANPP
ncbi:gene transfer agent family protein [Terrihabitans sp. B22-R8]|uniref:gene transfer agent family protein n=1 Tax=Terrihabitans sp. B22-R8 TaxID=3425128 RepID=UPI00403C61F8